MTRTPSVPPDDPLDRALDALPEDGGHAVVDGHHGRAEVEVAEVDRLGVRVRGLRVAHAVPRDVVREAERLPERTRALGEDLEAVEVDPRLGGAILRTRPDELAPRGDREFYELGVRPDETEVRRYVVGGDGERRATEWVMTRRGLRRLLDELGRDDDETP